MPQNIFIIIPARNEEHSIPAVINDLKQHGYTNIIVVDDGSTDATHQTATSLGVTVLTHYVNRGQGAALRTGTEYALNQNADIIVHFDADGQMRAEDIKTVTQPLINGTADLSFGSRFLTKGSNIPPLRTLILYGGKIFMRIFFNVRTTDPQSGFRCMTRKAARTVTITQRGMAHCSEILEEALKNKLTITEVPIIIRYTDYSKRHGQTNLAALTIASKLLWKKLMR